MPNDNFSSPQLPKNPWDFLSPWDYKRVAINLDKALGNTIDALKNALGPEENKLGDPQRTILEANGARLQLAMLIEKEKQDDGR